MGAFLTIRIISPDSFHKKKKAEDSSYTLFPSNINRDYSIERFNINPKRKSNYFDRWLITRKLVTLFLCPALLFRL